MYRGDGDDDSSAVYASGAPVASRFRQGSAGGSGSADHFGHFRESSPALEQEQRTYKNSTLQALSPYKVRDLFQSQAVRAMVSRSDVVKEAARELYVPRTAKLLQTEDFSTFNAAAVAYAATMANTTANARAKAAARTASLAAGGTSGAAGAGGGAAATVAAATASALAASDPNNKEALHLPIIPDTIDAFALDKAAATEAYLEDIWKQNRTKEASDERLRKHIKKLVHEWSSKLARFEEEVQRRQEDTYYARFRRQEAGNPLSKSMGSLDEAKTNSSQSGVTARAALMQQHRAFAEEQLTHHRRDAYTTTTLGKTDHQDRWTLGTDPAPDTKTVKVNKDAQQMRKQLLAHQMAYSVCSSSLAAPPAPSSLSVILAGAQASLPEGGLSPERTHLSFSAFRPTTTPSVRASQGDQEDTGTAEPTGRGRPGSGSGLLPRLFPSAPAGLSVRQTRPPAFATVPPAHVFSSPSLAQTAGITRPEYAAVPAHVRQRAELLEVERIKHRLAADRIAVPRGTLERALVPPEIRFSMEAMQTDLPTPFFTLAENPLAQQPKGKKKKGGKKGSKKK